MTDIQRRDPDLLANPSGTRLVGFAQVAAGVRRRRKLILTIAILGGCIGLGITFVLPRTTQSDATVLVQLPANVDPARGMTTELALLETRAVADRAAASPGLQTTADQLHSQYSGTIVSDNIMRVTAKGPNATVANARAGAVAAAYLATRADVYNNQVQTLVTALRDQQALLRQQAQSLTSQANTAPTGPQVGNILSNRDALNTQIQGLETTIDTDTAGMSSVLQSSKIIDAPTPRHSSMKKAAAINGVSGFLAAGFLALAVVVLIAITSTRVRRRADVAAALGAPVRVSVGPIIASRRRHFRRAPAIAGQARDDLELVVRHLQAAVAAAPNSALVIVSIDSLRVTSLAVQTLERALVAEGRSVQVVNETGPGTHEEPYARAQLNDPNGDAQIVLVIATLDPGKGAEHLREWATNVVAFVTTGRSTRTKLEASATMIRSAALYLRSVVLIDTDKDDESLGIVPTEHEAIADVEPASESSRAAQQS